MNFAISTLLLAVSASLVAGTEGPARPEWLQVKYAVIDPDDCHCLKDTQGLGLGIGTWLSPHWGVELDALRNALQSREGGIKANETEVQGALLLNLMNQESHWKPYLRAGAGMTRVETPFSLVPAATTRVTGHLGGGVQFHFGARGISSLELRSTGVDTRKYRRESAAIIGLGLRWGGATPPAQLTTAAPADLPPVKAIPEVPPVPAQPPSSPAAPEPVAPQPPSPPVLPEPASNAPAVPSLNPAAPEAQVPPSPPAGRIVLDQSMLHFGKDLSVIPAAAMGTLHQIASKLAAYQGAYTLTVTGHTSSDGSVSHNRTLSLARAKAVAKILIAAGIPANRIRVAGQGPDQPIADNRTAEGKNRNRRVEIDVQAKGVEVRRLPSADAPAL